MKLTIMFMISFCVAAYAKGFSQKINLTEKDVALQTVFKKIKQQTGYTFVYQLDVIKKAKKISIRVADADLSDVLELCFKNQPLSYSLVDNIVVVKPAVAVEIPKTVTIAAAAVAITVTGKVTDDKGNALTSVSIVVPGTPYGSMTNRNGEYSISNVPEGAKLYFSYIGYEAKTVEVKGRTVINVSLTMETKSLDETVIIGYGTTTKRRSTGSVASVTAEDIAKQPVQNPLNALQGRVAGAIITQSNGLPGSRVNILIRGTGTLGNGTVPLYIVDGVPFNIQDQAIPATNDLNSYGLSGANGGISPFSLINPADIERIDVLKDADATAIYGTRAANGVVLITTKKGKAGKTKFDLNVYEGRGKVGHYIDMLNEQQYLVLRRKAFANDGITPMAANAPDLFIYDTTQNTDWAKKYIGGTAKITDVQATVSGGDARTRFLMGAGYHKETTVFPGDQNDERATFRFSADHNSLDRKFNASISANYSFDKTNLTAVDLSSIYNLPPDYKLYNADGSLFWDANYTNPESRLLARYLGKTNNLISNAQLRYTLLQGLEFKTSLGFNKISGNQNLQTPIAAQNPNSAPTNNARFAYLDQQSYDVQPQFTYTKKIGRGNLTALAAAEWQRSLNTTTTISATGYSNPGLLASVTGAASYSPSGTYTLYKYNSFFGRLTYNWQDKYIFNGNIRRDGSSRFGENHKFGTFGSAGGAWVFTNESFTKNAFPFLSFGKLRASYGITGNDQFQDYQFLATFSTGSATSAYQGTSILTPTRVPNPDLHWETNKKLEVGLDLGFFRDRILVTANYYRNRSDNQLTYLNLPWQTGFNSTSGNFSALLQNKGFELEVNSKNIATADFTWKTSLNLTVPQNKLLEVDPNYFYASTYILGQSLNQIRRYTYVSVDPATGRPLYKDVSKDSVTLVPNFNLDRSLVGDAEPEYYGGMSNDFQYKSWNLSFFIQVTHNDGNIYPTGTPGVLGNVPAWWLSARMWQQPGDVAGAPKATTTSSVYTNLGSSDFAFGDNSFVKLRNISLSYTLPSAWISRIKMSNARIYAQAQNVKTWTKNRIAFDPETGTSTPPLRVITLGINASF